MTSWVVCPKKISWVEGVEMITWVGLARLGYFWLKMGLGWERGF